MCVESSPSHCDVFAIQRSDLTIVDVEDCNEEMTSKKYIAVDLYIETLENNFFFVMQKMAEFEVVTQELS